MKKWLIAIGVIILVILVTLTFQIPKKESKSQLSNIECFKNVNVSLNGDRDNVIGNVCYYTNISSKRCKRSDDCSREGGSCQFPLAYENSTPEIINFAKVGSGSSIIAKNVSGFCVDFDQSKIGLYLIVNNGDATFMYLLGSE